MLVVFVLFSFSAHMNTVVNQQNCQRQTNKQTNKRTFSTSSCKKTSKIDFYNTPDELFQSYLKRGDVPETLTSSLSIVSVTKKAFSFSTRSLPTLVICNNSGPTDPQS